MLKANSSQAKHAYIPPHVQAEMDHYMARMPAALQRQAQSGVYMSGQATKNMTDYMNKSLPAHLKEYVTPYVYQQSTTAHIGSNASMRPRVIQLQAPAPNPMRRDHSLGFGQQYTVPVAAKVQPETPTSLSFTQQYKPTQADAASPPDNQPLGSSTQPAASSGAYDFILNSHHHNSNDWLASASLKTRILVVAGGAVLLLVIAGIFVALITGHGVTNNDQLVVVAQEEAELVRISATPARSANQVATQNLAANIQLSLLSDQQAVVGYLSNAGAAPPSAILSQRQSKITDSDLQNAQADGTYDQTYIGIVKEQLTTYAQSVKQAFLSSTNQNEKQLLSRTYTNAQLLLAEAGQASS